MATTYEQELLRWAKAGGHGEPPSPSAGHRSSSVAEQRRPRRDFLTERIMRLDPDALYERAIPLPADIPLERLLNHFMSAWYCDYLDRTEPGWDERLTGRRY